MLVDTHAHIHFKDSFEDLPDVLSHARDNGVTKIITVGTDVDSSQAALDLVSKPEFAAAKTGVELFATFGLHPHEAGDGQAALDAILKLARENRDQIVAIGECGLDYFKNHSSVEEQKTALRMQIELAEELDLPLIFHVRDGWDDFFEILTGYKNVRGVIHSFTGGPDEVKKANRFGLYFGLNGIMTFTKDQSQLEAAKLIPANKLLLETDCPYLSPAPLRGKRNEPANVAIIARFLADLRGVELSELSEQTTGNAGQLFNIFK